MTGHEFGRSIRSDHQAMAWGTVTGTGVFLLFGLVTGLIRNPLYARMVPRTPIDYLLLTVTALLVGIYTAQRLATEVNDARPEDGGENDHTSSEDRLAMSGLIGGFLAVGCPICNVFLLALFSSSALMTYFDPLRPFLGVLSVAILAGLIYVRHRNSCPTCES